MEEKEKGPFCPKNVRQIGEIDGNYKIYVEDYVSTFLNQLVKKEEVGSRAILLLGEHYQVEETVYYLIYGAVCGKRKRLEEGIPLFEEEEREILLEIKKDKFKKQSIVGWAVMESQFNTVSEETLWKDMGNEFSKEGKVLFKIAQEDGKQNFFIHNYHRTILIEGYQIFYDKNEEMQNYLVDWHQENKDVPAEQVRDVAMKQFRTVVATKKETANQQKTLSFLYAVSSLLLILMCAMGITMLNNYEKLKRVETAMNHLIETMEEEKEMLAMRTQDYTLENNTNHRVDASAEEVMENTSTNVIESTENMVEEQPDTTTKQESSEQSEQNNTPLLEETAVTLVMPPMEYIVNHGDTLIGICKRFYQTTGKIQEICETNKISDPNNIVEGQKILLP